MARIYTRTGDGGTTRLADGSVVPKTHPRLAAYGALDELSAHLGLLRAVNDDGEMNAVVERVQSLLFEIGATLATPHAKESRISRDDVAWLEREIDKALDECPPLRAFILPGGAVAASHLHVARTVCRRAERSVAALAETDAISPVVLSFVNRLSDLLFALARLSNEREGIGDILWKARAR